MGLKAAGSSPLKRKRRAPIRVALAYHGESLSSSSHSIWAALLPRPNPWMTSISFSETLQRSLPTFSSLDWFSILFTFPFIPPLPFLIGGNSGSHWFHSFSYYWIDIYSERLSMSLEFIPDRSELEFAPCWPVKLLLALNRGVQLLLVQRVAILPGRKSSSSSFTLPPIPVFPIAFEYFGMTRPHYSELLTWFIIHLHWLQVLGSCLLSNDSGTPCPFWVRLGF